MHIANSRRILLCRLLHCCYRVRVNKTGNLRINVIFKRVRVTIFAVKKQEALHTWYQTFAVFWMLCAFFWAIPRHLNLICRRFGTLCLFHLHRQVGMKYTSYLPAYKDGTEYSETSAYKVQTPGNCSEGSANKYYIFWVRVCSFSYQAPKTRAPYFIVPYSGTFSRKRHEFWKRDWT